MKIVGLIGAKGAGKTTAYYIIRKHYAEVKEITLAGFLKDTCAQVFEIERHFFDSHKFKEKDLKDCIYITQEHLEALYSAYGIREEVNFNSHFRPHFGKILFTPRQVAQYVGTEILRHAKESIHCDAAYLKSSLEGGIAVVTDIRFPNEFDYFKDKADFFLPIYIKNTGAENEAVKDTHASEAHLIELAKRSIKVYNESSMEAFEKNLLQRLKENNL